MTSGASDLPTVRLIVPDANLLIYAVNHDAPNHRFARDWLEEVLSGSTPVGLAWLVLIAFIRITTHPRILQKPLSSQAAVDYVAGWLEQPFVTALNPGERHWMILSRLLSNHGAGGNLTNDAHLAAIAIEHGATLASADHDFQRFEGLEFFNPLHAGRVHERPAKP